MELIGTNGTSPPSPLAVNVSESLDKAASIHVAGFSSSPFAPGNGAVPDSSFSNGPVSPYQRSFGALSYLAASTSGPYIGACTLSSSGMRQVCRLMGRFNSIVSPFFHGPRKNGDTIE